jgi:hypothetical protein
MNFFEPVAHLIGWTNTQAFMLMIGIILLLPMGMYAWMRRRTWVE